ncbi:MAG: SDR family oxidoreductase [Acetobacteraceae bacterium]|nr:SDR family oxidoreductase [Acetobacteraceae bacterium]
MIFGLGYTGMAIANRARECSFNVSAANRSPRRGVSGCYPFEQAEQAIAQATHLVSTVPPDDRGDPVLAKYFEAIAVAPDLQWIGYISSTAVYGDRAGRWVDEDTPPKPTGVRGVRRLEAEAAWAHLADRRAVNLFRLAGIYGPERSPIDLIRSGAARRVSAPGHSFGRIHIDDIVEAVLCAIKQSPSPGVQVFNLADDEPAESADVLTEAARLLGVEPPPSIPLQEAWTAMSPMAQSFWAENRKVASRKTQEALGIRWRYPSYREGLRAILDAERIK